MKRAWGISLIGGLLILGACGEEENSGPGQEPSASEIPLDWTLDDRIKPYIQQCYSLGHFDEDTSDMLPVLVGKLRGSNRDVLRNVREELAALGLPALVEIDRLVRRLYSDRHSAHTIGNALGVVQMSSASGARVAQDLLRSCLGHPQETVRSAALRALATHAGPEIFDDLLSVLAITKGTDRLTVANALYQADAARTEELLASWIQEATHGDLFDVLARSVAAGAGAQTARLFAPLLEAPLERRTQAFLAATQDHAPADERDLSFLEEMHASEDPLARADALMALEHTSRLDLIAKTLISDGDFSLRRMACSVLVDFPEDPAVYLALTAGLNDEDATVRQSCLSALLAIGDPRAADSALEFWAGSQHELGIVTRAMAGHWKANPELPGRVFELLRGRIELRGEESLAHREFLIQALAQVPGPQSTEYLLELARSLREGIKGMNAHRFLTMQASNTGPAGLEVLRTAWRAEEETMRRFDLLWAATLAHDEATHAFLVEVLQAERTLPHERLWVAERLAREGPAAEVAPLLKRANLRLQDQVFRPAMECLLWRWYG